MRWAGAQACPRALSGHKTPPPRGGGFGLRARARRHATDRRAGA